MTLTLVSPCLIRGFDVGLHKRLPVPDIKPRTACSIWEQEPVRLSYFHKCGHCSSSKSFVADSVRCGEGTERGMLPPKQIIRLLAPNCRFISLTIFVQEVVISWDYVRAPSPVTPGAKCFRLQPPGRILPWGISWFRAFGAPGHIRVSYGFLPEAECLPAVRNLAEELLALTSEAEATASTKKWHTVSAAVGLS